MENNLDNTVIASQPGRAHANQALVDTPSTIRVRQTRPEVPFPYLDKDNYRQFDSVGPEYRANGAIIAQTSTAGVPYYLQLWIFVDNEANPLAGWKKADLNWPKKDSATGQARDQFLSLYSPLAQ
jgi:hypothetical protein